MGQRHPSAERNPHRQTKESRCNLEKDSKQAYPVIYLLDTTVLVDVLRGKQGRRKLLADLIRAGHTLATGAINIAEVYAGMRPAEAQATSEFLSDLDCFPVSVAIAQRAGTLKYAAPRRGKTLALADMLIASTALEHNCILLTDNRKDFPLPELTFHDLPPELP